MKGRSPAAVDIRPARSADLEGVNRVIEQAIEGWSLPERVRRLALPVYRYSATDFAHLDMVVALNERQAIIGVAAWEPADPGEAPAGQRALLLHGLYVDPACQRRGIGRRLLRCAERAARDGAYRGLLVKAQRDAGAFFAANGMSRLQVRDPLRHHPDRFWKQMVVA